MGELTANPQARVFLVIENRFLRESLARLFRKRSELSVIGETSPSDPDSRFAELFSRCDVLVGDYLVPACLRLERGENDAAASPKVALIGMSPDENQFLQAVRAGVTGYVLADASAADVVAAVRAVARGEAVCPPRLCLALFRAIAQPARPAPVPMVPVPLDLTLRQQQLLTLVAKGLTNKEIAAQLNLSEFTVRNHIQRILRQLDAESRHEAVETIRAQGHLTTA
jgi:DNA-binding NarL/FixJ family response regulator